MREGVKTALPWVSVIRAQAVPEADRNGAGHPGATGSAQPVCQHSFAAAGHTRYAMKKRSSRHDLHGQRVPIDFPLLPVTLVAEQCRGRGAVAEYRVLINGLAFADR